jgi:hypothetical protein
VMSGKRSILQGVQFSDNGQIFADLHTDEGTSRNRAMRSAAWRRSEGVRILCLLARLDNHERPAVYPHQ